MVCIAYLLAAVYVLFAIFIVLEEWYPQHREAYYTETSVIWVLLWVAFGAIVLWSFRDRMNDD